jgi:hypothetical protein
VALNFPASPVDRDDHQTHHIESLAADASLGLGVTEFSNEATTITNVNEGRGSIRTVIPDEHYQDIKEYFARPRLVSKFNAATTRSSLFNTNVTDWVTNFWPVAAVNRLNGVFAYKCTARVTLTLAATPFQQGLVTVGFQYAGDSNGFTLARQLHGPLSTNVPHARLNFSDTTIAEIDIPFVYPWDYIEIANATSGGGDNYKYTYGNLGVYQQLPYVVLAGSTAPRMSLYVSLIDMELFGAVPVSLNAILPQSGLTTMNEEAKRTRVVSRVLSGVSSTSSTVAKVAGSLGAPAVGSIASSVSWMAEKLAGTARSFGYSNPINEAPNTRVTFNISDSSSNVDVPDNSVVVGPFSSNRLDVSPLDGARIDEMSMPYVLGQYNQIFVGQLTTALTDGQFIYATRCCPTNFWFRTNAGVPGGNLALPTASTLTTNCIAPSTLCYLGSMFRYFRGGLKFRFTFAKTKFHAGRVVATFVPSTEDFAGTNVGSSLVPLPEVTAGVGLQPFTSSAVFDLKDDSTFEFEVPYVCTRPHLSTNGSFGGVSLAVLDVLRTTGETSTTVSFMVEVCGAPDFEFSNYAGGTMMPLFGSAINAQPVILQSGLDEVKTLEDKPLEVVQFTMGEKVSSLKELIMIPSYTQTFMNSAEVITGNLPPWSYYPWWPSGLTPPVSLTTQIRFSCSPGNMIASMYAFTSGGTTYHIVTDSNDTRISVRQDSLDAGTVPLTVSDMRYRGDANMPRHYASGSTVTALHAKCPSYQKTPLVPRDQHGFMNNPSGRYEPRALISNVRTSPFINTNWQFSATNKKSGGIVNYLYIGLCGSDDAKCHHYIGPPLVLLTASTSTTTVAESSATGF